KVSLADNSKKNSMDLRLLYGVAYSESWFGRWGYRFGRGTFGVTQQMYQNAIEAIQNIPLNFFLPYHHLGSSNIEVIPILLSRYQTLSGHSLVTLGHLFRFMFELKLRLPNDGFIDASNNRGMLVDTACRWSPKRVEMATRVIVESLKRAEFRWVSRQEIRDSARAYIGDTGLLDFVLKSLGNRIVGIIWLVKDGAKLVIEGRTLGKSGILLHESICEGIQSHRVVECPCGAKNEDGERIVSCDICEVWQHTRCVRIPNNEEVPDIFLCSQCEKYVLLLPSVP
ncbi:unnamed protein product, partial [Ilex paraguariensis]